MEIHNSYFIIGQVFIASKILRNKPTQCYWRWLMLLTTSFSLTENIQDFITWDFDIFVMAVTHYLCTPGSNSLLEETTQSAKCSLLLWQSRSLLPTSPGASYNKAECSGAWRNDGLAPDIKCVFQLMSRGLCVQCLMSPTAANIRIYLSLLSELSFVNWQYNVMRLAWGGLQRLKECRFVKVLKPPGEIK